MSYIEPPIGPVAAMGSFAGAEQSSVAGQPPARVQEPKPVPDEELVVEPEELDVVPEDDPVWDPDDDPVPPEPDPLLLPVLAEPAHATTPQASSPTA
jgi:hypothetical protein